MLDDVERGGDGGAITSPTENTEREGALGFSEKSIRMAFIRKVYFILTIQIGISSLFIGACCLHQPTKHYVQSHPFLFWIALGVMIVTLLSISCCQSVRRSSPMNVIFLGLFTFAMSFILGIITSFYKVELVFYAALITCVVCLALTMFAFQTKLDFTMLGGVLIVCGIVICVFAIFLIFFHGKVMMLVYSSLCAILFSVYLIYDTQMMIGGNHKHSISPEEYIFAALTLYMDVLNIFIAILQILEASSD